MYNNELIKGKRFLLPKDVKKYQIGSKSKVKELIENNGGIIIKDKYESEEFDYILMGSEVKYGGIALGKRIKKYNAQVLFEQELLVFSPEIKTFPNFFKFCMDRMRAIFSQEDIMVAHYSVGKPYTAKDFKSLEKKLKHPIPNEIKEFYSIFGKFKLIWGYMSININRSFYDEKDALNIIAPKCGEMYGSIQILDLKRLLSYDWSNDYAVELESGEKLKIFDYYSDYHMMAFSLEKEKSYVYAGDDHGATFSDCKPLLFVDYLKLLFNSYGFFYRQYLFDGAYEGGIKTKLPSLSAVLNNPIKLIPQKLDNGASI